MFHAEHFGFFQIYVEHDSARHEYLTLHTKKQASLRPPDPAGRERPQEVRSQRRDDPGLRHAHHRRGLRQR